MRTLYEDDDLLAVSKPAGMVVHPTYKNKTGTLVDAIASPAVPRPSVVGRLDKWTSGIVVVAKTAAAHAALQRALSAPETEKTYLALVAGRVDEPSGSIDLRLKVDPGDRRRVIVAHDGSPSVTHFERLAVFEPPGATIALIRCRPLTGRRHQIRVHLSARGSPIVGDRVYGSAVAVDDPRLAAAIAGLGGQALHAAQLTFVHPFTHRFVEFKASLPDNFDSLLTLLASKVIL